MSSVIAEIKKHKDLWVFGLHVFSVIAAIGLTVGVNETEGQWFNKPHLWILYGVAVRNYVPWANIGLLIATIACWIAASFMITTVLAALTGRLSVQNKFRILIIDVLITLAYAIMLGYASFHYWLLSWPFMLLVLLTLWGQTIALGYKPDLITTAIGFRNKAVKLLIVCTLLSAVAVCFFSFRQWVFIDAWRHGAIITIYIFLILWIITLLMIYNPVFKKGNLLAYAGTYASIVALSFTIGIEHHPTSFGILNSLNTTLWLPYYGYFSYGDLHSLLWAPGHDSFVFTLVYWAIVTFILVTTGKTLYRSYRNRG